MSPASRNCDRGAFYAAVGRIATNFAADGWGHLAALHLVEPADKRRLAGHLSLLIADLMSTKAALVVTVAKKFEMLAEFRQVSSQSDE